MKMWTDIGIRFAVVAAVLVLGANVALVYAGQGCITQKCHAGMLGFKFVHGPVAVQDCVMCHKQTGDHSFKIAAQGSDLCYICHDRMPKGHGDACTKCHDPHGSDKEFQLKANVKR